MDESEKERIRRLIEARVREQTPLNLFSLWIAPATRTMEALTRALAAQQEANAGIPQGPANTPSSWSALERSLGKDLMNRLRRK